MAYLLDTHTVIWLLNEPEQLSLRARQIITTTPRPLQVSIASLWEIVIKSGLGKLELDIPFAAIFEQLLSHGIQFLSIEPAHLTAYLSLPLHHRDPFDRILVAQAMANNLTLISKDKKFEAYPVSVLW